MPDVATPEPTTRLESVEIDAGGARVHALARPGPRPVVFVHGLGASSAYFADAGQRAELDGRGVVALDLPGFGRSPAPDGFGFTMREQARVVEAAVAALGLERVTLVGHSMGGTVALLAAPRLRPRLAALVLAEAVLVHDEEIWTEQVARMTPESWALEFESIRRRPEVFARGGMLRRRVEAVRRVAPAVTQTTARAMHAAARDLQRTADDPRLYASFLALDLPRVYVYGEYHETSYMAAWLRRDGAPVAVVPGAAHLMMLDNPDAFYPIVAGAGK